MIKGIGVIDEAGVDEVEEVGVVVIAKAAMAEEIEMK